MDIKNLKMARVIEDRVLRCANVAAVADHVSENAVANSDFDKAAAMAAKMRQVSANINLAVKLLAARKNRRAALIQANKLLNAGYVSTIEKEVYNAQ